VIEKVFDQNKIGVNPCLKNNWKMVQCLKMYLIYIYIGGYCDKCQDMMIGLKLPVLAKMFQVRDVQEALG
jgi:hypothetical protein